MMDLDPALPYILNCISCKCKASSQRQCCCNTCSCKKNGLHCVVACAECHGYENAFKHSLATNIYENDNSDTEDYDIL